MSQDFGSLPLTQKPFEVEGFSGNVVLVSPSIDCYGNLKSVSVNESPLVCFCLLTCCEELIITLQYLLSICFCCGSLKSLTVIFKLFCYYFTAALFHLCFYLFTRCLLLYPQLTSPSLPYYYYYYHYLLTLGTWMSAQSSDPDSCTFTVTLIAKLVCSANLE